jgi:hypothetical protein
MINLKQFLVFVEAEDNAIADTYFGDIHLRRKGCFVCHSFRLREMQPSKAA